MNYKVNEIFYSVQGEGWYTGTAAIFIRFSGCNLKCPFCDTKHEEGSFMTTEQIIAFAKDIPCRLVVLTGGEPSLFVKEELIEALHQCGKIVAMETNGTHVLPKGLDWVTLSPKTDFVPDADIVLEEANEVKVVFTGENNLKRWEAVKADYYYAQPCDTGDKEKNTEILAQAIQFCKMNPNWRISLQTQKILNVR